MVINNNLKKRKNLKTKKINQKKLQKNYSIDDNNKMECRSHNAKQDGKCYNKSPKFNYRHHYSCVWCKTNCHNCQKEICEGCADVTVLTRGDLSTISFCSKWCRKQFPVINCELHNIQVSSQCEDCNKNTCFYCNIMKCVKCYRDVCVNCRSKVETVKEDTFICNKCMKKDTINNTILILKSLTTSF